MSELNEEELFAAALEALTVQALNHIELDPIATHIANMFNSPPPTATQFLEAQIMFMQLPEEKNALIPAYFRDSLVEPIPNITIRDMTTNYVATTGFSIGENGVLADQFQINLEYQDGVDSAAVDLWNDWSGAVGGATAADGTNWHDPENYTLVVDVNGGLAATTYTGEVLNPALADHSDNLQWTITGWDQTILGGHIDGNRLVVYPANTYRPFNPLLNVNVQENFSGHIKTELTALTFGGEAKDIGSGTVFGVERLTSTKALIDAEIAAQIAAENARKYKVIQSDMASAHFTGTKEVDPNAHLEVLDAAEGSVESALGSAYNNGGLQFELQIKKSVWDSKFGWVFNLNNSNTIGGHGENGGSFVCTKKADFSLADMTVIWGATTPDIMERAVTNAVTRQHMTTDSLTLMEDEGRGKANLAGDKSNVLASSLTAGSLPKTLAEALCGTSSSSLNAATTQRKIISDVAKKFTGYDVTGDDQAITMADLIVAGHTFSFELAISAKCLNSRSGGTGLYGAPAYGIARLTLID
jgi:hypothetical protein